MNTHTFGSDMRRAIASKGFLFGTLGLVLVVILSSVESVIMLTRFDHHIPYGYHAQFIMEAFASDWFTLALPILCALPFTAAFVDDIKSGYIKPYLHRTTIGQYIKSKLAACALSGGLALFAGAVLSYALAALVFAPMELAPDEWEVAQPWFARMPVILS